MSKFLSIGVNTYKKAKRISSLLRQGRRGGLIEEFWTESGPFYTVFYYAKEEEK